MAANTSHIGFIDCSSKNVDQSSYVQIPFGSQDVNPITFENTGINASKIEITDTTGKILKIASGPAGSQVDLFTCAPSATIVINNIYIPINTPLWVTALDSTNAASTGYIVVSLA